jgi:hypothetical protein
MTYKFWEHFKIEDDKIVFTIPEPKEIDERKSKLWGMKIETDEHRAWDIANKHFIGLNSISKELRQEILMKFRKGGITIGETAKLFNTTSDIVSDVIVFNIQDIPILRSESI